MSKTVRWRDQRRSEQADHRNQKTVYHHRNALLTIEDIVEVDLELPGAILHSPRVSVNRRIPLVSPGSLSGRCTGPGCYRGRYWGDVPFPRAPGSQLDAALRTRGSSCP